jgi:hypothetical protein
MQNVSIGLLDRLRYRNSAGRLIRAHRALLRIQLPRGRWLQPLLLPTAFFLLVLVMLRPIGLLWMSVLEFWTTQLQLPGRVVTEGRWLGDLKVYDLPFVDVAARAPQSSELFICLVLVLLTMGMSYLLLRRSLPIAYIVWAFCLIQLISILFFWSRPDQFPYSIAGHVRGGLEMNVALMLVLPWILAPTYYAFEFTVSKKILVTVLIMLHIVIFAPLQYMAHAKMIHDLSLLAMPLLFIMFGLFVNVFCFIAIYGWAMSWDRIQVT